MKKVVKQTTETSKKQQEWKKSFKEGLDDDYGDEISNVQEGADFNIEKPAEPSIQAKAEVLFQFLKNVKASMIYLLIKFTQNTEIYKDG